MQPQLMERHASSKCDLCLHQNMSQMGEMNYLLNIPILPYGQQQASLTGCQTCRKLKGPSRTPSNSGKSMYTLI